MKSSNFTLEQSNCGDVLTFLREDVGFQLSFPEVAREIAFEFNNHYCPNIKRILHLDV